MERFIGDGFDEIVREYILKRYLGEQPLGSAFILPIQNGYFQYAIVVPLFRLSITKKSEYSEFDMGKIPDDYAYNATRGLLLAILRHNSARAETMIENVFLPDFHSIRMEASNDTVGSDSLLQCITQIGIGIHGVLFPSRAAKEWTDAITLQKLLYRTSDEVLPDDEYISTEEELDTIISEIRSSNTENSIIACKILSLNLKNDRIPNTLSKSEIVFKICDNLHGCLSIVLDSVAKGHITVHTTINNSELEFSHKIGHGTSGTVFSGFWKGIPVAIKEFNDMFTREEFLKELSIMSLLEHNNLVKCYGGSVEPKTIILELMQTNIFDLLQSPIKLDLGMKIKIASEVARGMEYLHEQCHLIHRDLKSLNLLVKETSEEIQVRICDFGISRVIDTKSVMTGNVGTVSWIAPEILEHKKYSEKADVYSFGIILWEIITRNEPFSNLSGFSIPIAVIKGERPPIPRNCPKEIKKLIRLCWSGKPKKRPKFSKIHDILEKIYKNVNPTEKQQLALQLGTSEYKKIDLTNSRAIQRNRKKELDSLFSESDDSSHSTTTLEKSNELSESYANSQPYENKKTVTCIIPNEWAGPIAELEFIVNSYFSRLDQDVDRGVLKIVKDRYILFRGKNLSIDFMNSIKNNFNFQKKSHSFQFSYNLLCGLGSSMGKTDAINFLKHNSDTTDTISLQNAAFVFASYTGIAYVELLDDTVFSDDPQTYKMIFEFKESYEVDSYKSSHKKISHCSCILGSGYLSGWMEVVTQTFQVTAEIQCRTKGDDRCLFIRAAPEILEAEIEKYCLENYIDYNGIPSHIMEQILSPDSVNWFEENWRKILWKNDDFVPGPTRENLGDVLSKYDIAERVNTELDKLYIDPREGKVEVADDKCVMLRADILTTRFHYMIEDLMVNSVENPMVYTSKFMYFLGKSMGTSNSEWFSGKITLTNSIDKAQSILALFQYFGWSNLKFTSPISASRLKKKDEGEISLSCSTSFEALSWRKLKVEGKHTRCFLHSGFIAGWFEHCFNFPISCVEKSCVATGAKRCTFVVGTPQKLSSLADDQDFPLYEFALQPKTLIPRDRARTDTPTQRPLLTSKGKGKSKKKISSSKGKRKSKRTISTKGGSPKQKHQ